jgi:hypothetical protein
MSRSVLASAFLAAGLVACGAWAQDAPHGVGEQAAAPPAAAAAGTPADRLADRNCLRDTGSLIPPKPGHCLPVAGRSYTRDDLRRTGATRTGEALERLDPSLEVRGH